MYWEGIKGLDGANGVDGVDGAAGTITVGTVTTGAPGTPAQVTNVGTLTDAIFNFVIPEGDPGTDILPTNNVWTGTNTWNAASTFAGGVQKRFNTLAGADVGTAANNVNTAGGLEVFQSDNTGDAFLSFHINSKYAIHLGLNGDTNRVSVGGWTAGAGWSALYHEGYKGFLGDTNTWTAEQTFGTIQTSLVKTGGPGSGQVALTVNDGGGNANITFNHTGKVPDVTGNYGRMSVNVDSTSDPQLYFLLGTGTQGSPTVGTQVLNLRPTSIALANKRAITFSDTWLRLNHTSAFTSGILTGTSLVRSDAGFQVGTSGATFKADATDLTWLGSNVATQARPIDTYAITDTRALTATNREPHDYDDYQGAIEFTNQDKPSSASWFVKQTFRGWTGGFAVSQLAFGSDSPVLSPSQRVYHRAGQNASWGPWNVIQGMRHYYNPGTRTFSGQGASEIVVERNVSGAPTFTIDDSSFSAGDKLIVYSRTGTTGTITVTTDNGQFYYNGVAIGATQTMTALDDGYRAVFMKQASGYWTVEVSNL